MLAGRPAFSGPDLAAIGTAVQQREPPPLAALRPDVPAEIVATIARCLRKAPTERFRSAVELGLALAPWATTLGRPTVAELGRMGDPNVSSARLAMAPGVAALALGAQGGGRGDLASAPTMSVGGPTVHDPAVAEPAPSAASPAWTPPAALPLAPGRPVSSSPVAPTMGEWVPTGSPALSPAAGLTPQPSFTPQPSPTPPPAYPTPSYYPPTGGYASVYPPAAPPGAAPASPLPWLLAGFGIAVLLVAVAVVVWLVL
jgi:hypothetical protein